MAGEDNPPGESGPLAAGNGSLVGLLVKDRAA